MKPLFSIHEGEFLVGDHITRKCNKRYEVWVPTKDTGADLLVTQRKRLSKSVRLQVKFSRGFSILQEMAEAVLATSWFTLDPLKVRRSRVELWVFVVVTWKHESHFVVIPTKELKRRIPRHAGKKWHLYLWIYKDGSCFQVRDLSKHEKLATVRAGVEDRRHDWSAWLGRWDLLDGDGRRRR